MKGIYGVRFRKLNEILKESKRRGVVISLAITFEGATLLWNRTLKKQVESKTKELEEINRTLEEKVHERTKLLNESNIQLHNSMDDLHVKQEELTDTNIALNQSLKNLKNTMTELI